MLLLLSTIDSSAKLDNRCVRRARICCHGGIFDGYPILGDPNDDDEGSFRILPWIIDEAEKDKKDNTCRSCRALVLQGTVYTNAVVVDDSFVVADVVALTVLVARRPTSAILQQRLRNRSLWMRLSSTNGITSMVAGNDL
jgi:hypothetical protein